jgi:RNA polymerase primary sigma factor
MSRKPREGNLERFLREIRDFPILTREEESRLSRVPEGSSDGARHELIQSNLKFVVKIAREYRDRGLPMEDLLGDGILGLVRAARVYDPARGTRFVSCAVWWIRKAILEALSRNAPAVRIPRHQIRRLREARSAEQALALGLGRKPDRLEISRHLRVDSDELDALLLLGGTRVSLEAPAGSDRGSRLKDLLADPGARSPESELLRGEAQEILQEALRLLPDRDREVLSLRFGLDGQTRTLQEVGARFGVSRELVRQVETRAKRRLWRLYLEVRRRQRDRRNRLETTRAGVIPAGVRASGGLSAGAATPDSPSPAPPPR